MVERRLWLWRVSAVMGVATVGACYLSGFTLTPNSWASFGAVLGVIALSLCVDPNAFGRFSSISKAADAFLLYTVISLLGAVMSYLAMRHSGPFTDSLLHRADASFGLSWVAIREVTERVPFLLDVLNSAYFTCFFMPLVIIAFLTGSENSSRLYHFISAHGSALLVTVVVAGFFPAQAAFVFYEYPDLPGNALHYGGVIAGLKDGSLTAIDLQDLGGIITFPSFHAAMAVLFTWALWPFRYARTMLVIINGLMWAAAVPIGGHYVVDLFGGSLIAWMAIALTSPSQKSQMAANLGRWRNSRFALSRRRAQSA